MINDKDFTVVYSDQIARTDLRKWSIYIFNSDKHLWNKVDGDWVKAFRQSAKSSAWALLAHYDYDSKIIYLKPYRFSDGG